MWAQNLVVDERVLNTSRSTLTIFPDHLLFCDILVVPLNVLLSNIMKHVGQPNTLKERNYVTFLYRIRYNKNKRSNLFPSHFREDKQVWNCETKIRYQLPGPSFFTPCQLNISEKGNQLCNINIIECKKNKIRKTGKRKLFILQIIKI